MNAFSRQEVNSLSAKARAQKARQYALVAKAEELLSKHGWKHPVTPGRFIQSRNCGTCGRAFECVTSAGGGHLCASYDEEARIWLVEILRANGKRHKLSLRDGEYCPVLALALAELKKDVEQ